MSQAPDRPGLQAHKNADRFRSRRQEQKRI